MNENYQMIKNSNRLFITGCIISAITILSIGCNEINISSKWRTQDINIDGKNTEWKSGNYIDEANALVNICNDENFLYLSFTTNDRNLPMNILRNGLTVWFDSEGKSNKIFGIRFPAGIKNHGMPEDMGQFDRKMDKNNQMPMPKMEFSEIELLNEDGEVEAVLSTLETKNIQIKMSNPQGNFFYEMKVPLKTSGDFLYAINADTSKIISIGFETAEKDFNKMKGQMESGGRGMPPDGGGAPASGGGPGGGGMPPGGGQGKGPDSSTQYSPISRSEYVVAK